MLVETLLEANHDRPNLLAVRDRTMTLTYRRLTILASVIRDLVRRNSQAEHIGIMLPSGGAFASSLFGTLWASRVPVPLNFLLAPAELSNVVRDAGLDLILSTHHFDKLASELPARTICLEDQPLKRRAFWATLRRLPALPAIDPDSVAVLLYTSGTSGPCKGVELTFRNLRSNSDALITAANIGDGDRFLALVPPFHVLGLTANVLVPVVSKVSVLAIPRFNPRAVFRAIQEFAPTIAIAIPSMFGALMRDSSSPPDAFKSFRLLVSGGEPLPDRIADAFRKRFGLQLSEGYGLTETSPVVSLNHPGARRDGSVGKPLPGVEVRLVSDDGQDAPSGQDGEIWIRGPNVMRGYHNRPDETAEVLTPDGFFTTGDIGRIDEDGYLFITGRKKEMIIVGGENVFPREIETALEKHAAVEEAAVTGLQDRSRGEVPLAFVTLKPGAAATDIELRSFAREHLAGYKVPREVRIIDEFPRGPTGKVAKQILLEMAEAGL